MGNSFVLFYVSIVISHGQFHCGSRGHPQNTDSPWIKSHFPVGKRSSGTATNLGQNKLKSKTNLPLITDELDLRNLKRIRFSINKIGARGGLYF